jgi:hypothetical protein
MHPVEPGKLARADHAHAESLAFRRQNLGDLADAEYADRLVM